jgi:hypothetical protein
MSRFGYLASDSSKELSGVWRTWTNGPHSIDFLLKRAGGANTEFKIAFEEATRTFRRNGVDIFTLAPEKQDEIMRPLYADHVFLNWRGEPVADLEFTRDNLIELLTEVPAVLYWAIAEAQSDSNYRNAARDIDKGN